MAKAVVPFIWTRPVRASAQRALSEVFLSEVFQKVKVHLKVKEIPTSRSLSRTVRAGCQGL